MRKFKVAIAKDCTARGIGIEEHVDEEIVYIASLYCDRLSRKETLDHYIKHITGLLAEGEQARIRVLDELLFNKRTWFTVYPNTEIIPYQRGTGNFRTTLMLAIDGLERKTNIIERL